MQSALLSYRQLLSHTAKLFTFRVRTLLALCGVLQLGIMLVRSFFSTGITGGGIILWILWSAGGLFIFAAVALALKTSVDKEDAPFAEILKRAGSRMLPLLGASIIVGAVSFIALLVLLGASGIGFILAGREGMLTAVGLSGLLGAVILATAMIYISFFALAIVLDKKSVIDSFAYSVRLVKGHFWYVAGFVLLLGLGAFVFSVLSALCQMLCFTFAAFSAALSLTLIWLINFITGVIISAFTQTANTVFYLNITGRIHPSAQPAEPEPVELPEL